MIQTDIGNRVRVKWFGDEYLKEVAKVTEKEQQESSERVYRNVLKFTPTGSYRRSYRKEYKNALGNMVRMKGWQQRLSGRLRSTIRRLKSKYKGGGWIVYGGSWLAYYARIVEYGTKVRRQKTTGRFTGKAKAARYMRKALSLEQAKFKSGVVRSLNKIWGTNKSVKPLSSLPRMDLLKMFGIK